MKQHFPTVPDNAASLELTYPGQVHDQARRMHIASGVSEVVGVLVLAGAARLEPGFLKTMLNTIGSASITFGLTVGREGSRLDDEYQRATKTAQQEPRLNY